MLVVPKSRFKSQVDHQLWNNLPEEKPLTKSVAFFQIAYKKHIFMNFFFAFFNVIFSMSSQVIFLIAFACVHVNLSVKMIA